MKTTKTTSEAIVTASGEQVKLGTVLFGQVNGCGPAKWKFGGRRGTSQTLEHVPSGSQTPFADQFVSWDQIRLLAANS